MKENKGITLIALIVTIIVLIILAGVAIAMLRGDNGILNRASQARYENAVASFDEQARLAGMSLRTEITSNMVNAGDTGYIATTADNFTALVNQVRSELGIADNTKTFKKENFSVIGFLDQAGSTSLDGVGYILITYTDNALRSSLPSDAGKTSNWTCNGVTFTKTGSGIASSNQAVLAYVIKVTNYKCELSNAIITDTTTVAGADADGNGGDWKTTGIYQDTAATYTAAGFATKPTLDSASTATTIK